MKNKALLVVASILALAVPVIAQQKRFNPSVPYEAVMYIQPCGGFETYLAAALEKKQVPLKLVGDPSAASFTMECTSVVGKGPSAAEVIWLGKMKPNADASVKILNGSKTIVWAYSVHKYSSVRGQQSTAEAVAKHLKDSMVENRVM